MTLILLPCCSEIVSYALTHTKYFTAIPSFPCQTSFSADQQPQNYPFTHSPTSLNSKNCTNERYSERHRVSSAKLTLLGLAPHTHTHTLCEGFFASGGKGALNTADEGAVTPFPAVTAAALLPPYTPPPLLIPTRASPSTRVLNIRFFGGVATRPWLLLLLPPPAPPPTPDARLAAGAVMWSLLAADAAAADLCDMPAGGAGVCGAATW